jgi:hypothetical protein
MNQMWLTIFSQCVIVGAALLHAMCSYVGFCCSILNTEVDRRYCSSLRRKLDPQQVSGRHTKGVRVIQGWRSKKVRVRSGWLVVRLFTCCASNKVSRHAFLACADRDLQLAYPEAPSNVHFTAWGSFESTDGAQAKYSLAIFCVLGAIPTFKTVHCLPPTLEVLS